MSATDDAEYLREFDHLTLVRLLIAAHRANPGTGAIGQAVSLLDRMHEAAATSGRAGSLIEIRMLQALALHAQGHRPQARKWLGRALAEAAEPDGYARLFLDEGLPMRRCWNMPSSRAAPPLTARVACSASAMPAMVQPMWHLSALSGRSVNS